MRPLSSAPLCGPAAWAGWTHRQMALVGFSAHKNPYWGHVVAGAQLCGATSRHTNTRLCRHNVANERPTCAGVKAASVKQHAQVCTVYMSVLGAAIGSCPPAYAFARCCEPAHKQTPVQLQKSRDGQCQHARWMHSTVVWHETVSGSPSLAAWPNSRAACCSMAAAKCCRQSCKSAGAPCTSTHPHRHPPIPPHIHTHSSARSFQEAGKQASTNNQLHGQHVNQMRIAFPIGTNAAMVARQLYCSATLQCGPHSRVAVGQGLATAHHAPRHNSIPCTSLTNRRQLLATTNSPRTSLPGHWLALLYGTTCRISHYQPNCADGRQ